jgi:hypothetical protein
VKAPRIRPAPFALSLSKGFPFSAAREGMGFDKLSPNGVSLYRYPQFPKAKS